ncbi:hypothetical protein FISHEDRAFT_58747 [Fistulina hepatica ATCC 64428]|uniref:Reverse transcriptase domain-containing protein n=1 Tax=Fistulina hepatica ATCC 64428 TaxID=1128425 RepID=A0A0D7ACG2_9AGAR|nr:hypothetical protein FISHEDRAFT_58747 [Fistulina hepatica ATCC 64428]
MGLAKMMIDYAEVSEEDGMIVVLDQEKAYDKIGHDYLWKILERYNIPEDIRWTIQALYTDAEMALFADDTTVYLSSEDDFRSLTIMLDKWCIASRAKFNEEKMVVIPLGDPEARNIPTAIKVLRDEETTRILGAQVGNSKNAVQPWTPVVEKVDETLQRWSLKHPTLEGKRLLVQWFPGGMTLFLTMAQGMPEDVEDKLEKRICDFVQENDNSPYVGMDTMMLPKEEGGRGILDVRARNEAAKIILLQDYLKSGEGRPIWVFFADEVFRVNAAKQIAQDKSSLADPITQTWKVATRKSAALSKMLKDILWMARKYKVQLAVLNPNEQLQDEMPPWHHPGIQQGYRQRVNYKEDHCLRRHHSVSNVGELKRLAQRHADFEQPQMGCTCPDCAKDRHNGCECPAQCIEEAREILAILGPKWWMQPRQLNDLVLSQGQINENRRALKENEAVLFNPSLESEPPLMDNIRIFTNNQKNVSLLPLTQPP